MVVLGKVGEFFLGLEMKKAGVREAIEYKMKIWSWRGMEKFERHWRGFETVWRIDWVWRKKIRVKFRGIELKKRRKFIFTRREKKKKKFKKKILNLQFFVYLNFEGVKKNMIENWEGMNYRLSKEQIKGLDKKLEWILEVKNEKMCEIYFHSALKKKFNWKKDQIFWICNFLFI